jgi:hypothetical protein
MPEGSGASAAGVGTVSNVKNLIDQAASYQKGRIAQVVHTGARSLQKLLDGAGVSTSVAPVFALPGMPYDT